KIRSATPEDLVQSSFDFHDVRLPELLFRYRARNFPHSLTQQEQQRWREFCRWRLTDPASGAGMVWEAFHARLQTLQESDSVTDAQKHILQQLSLYAAEQLQQVS